MKIKLISDIHVEFGHPNSMVPDRLPNEGVDVLVIAGDLAVGYKKRLKKALRKFCDRFEHVIFVLGNHDCLDTETELLTLRGWIKYNEIQPMDMVLSITPEETAAWVPINKVIIKEANDIYCYENQAVSFGITKGHRIPFYLRKANGEFSDLRYGTSQDIPNTRINLPCARKVENRELDFIEDDEIRLLAWILTDGGCQNHLFSIYQSKPEGIQRIKNVLSNLGYKYTFTSRDREIKEIAGKKIKSCLSQGQFYIKSESSGLLRRWIFSDKTPNKNMFRHLSARQFRIFIREAMNGDGSWAPGRQAGALNGTKEFLEWVQSLAVQSGIRSSLVEYRPGAFRLNLAFNKENTQVENLARGLKKTQYNGTVWCLNVPYSNFAVRRNGKAFFTGNCWHSSIERRHESLNNLSSKIDNLHFLEKSSTVIDGQRFIGATGWYPNSIIAMQLGDKWPDQRLIEGKRDAIIAEHAKTEEFLKNNVQRGDIVVTHHLPVQECAHPRWRHNTCNVFFSSNFDAIIWHQPDFWFFGHTHDFRHLTLGDTELICNPYGYPHETAYQGYTDDLIIDTTL